MLSHHAVILFYFSLSIFLQFLFKLLFVVHVWYYLSFFFTVKVLEKRHIIREKKAQYVSREKEVLSRLNHPFFVRLYFTFQDKEKLCILTTKTLFVFWYLSRSISSNRGFLIGIKENMLLAILNRIHVYAARLHLRDVILSKGFWPNGFNKPLTITLGYVCSCTVLFGAKQSPNSKMIAVKIMKWIIA